MNSLLVLLVILSAVLFSYLLSGKVREYAISLCLMDMPNERSSHSAPVPRGGGVALAFVFLLLLPVLSWLVAAPVSLNTALYGAGALIAVVGFFDDRSHIPAHKRLVAHIVAAGWIVYLLYIAPVSDEQRGDLWLWLSAIAFTLFLVWLLNLYNFMDGIDTITGSETLTVTLSAAILSWYLMPWDPSWLILLLLAASVAGFLLWNLPPAKLFMGDSGSAFLGIVIGALVVYAYQQSVPLFYAWLILLGVYFVDATLTLIRRILAGEKFYQAHSTHAYQHAARRYRSHGKVSLAIALINLLWLLPMALSVVLGLLDGPAAVVIGYLPLLAAAFYFKAGIRQVA